MNRDTKFMFAAGLACLIIAVLYGIFPHTAPVNPYLAVGTFCFMGGLILGLVIFVVVRDYTIKQEAK